MNKTTRAVLGMVERAMRIKVEKDSNHRPPLCMGFLHQPRRPDKKNK